MLTGELAHCIMEIRNLLRGEKRCPLERPTQQKCILAISEASHIIALRTLKCQDMRLHRRRDKGIFRLPERLTKPILHSMRSGFFFSGEKDRSEERKDEKDYRIVDGSRHGA